jgi:Abnormal spindle-like microcephaly-assoc'd, ASPM-SPD-2-Hydin
MDAIRNEKKINPTRSSQKKTFAVKRAVLIAGLGLLAAWQYGCAGVVGQSTKSTPTPTATPQLIATPGSVSFGSVSDGTTNTQSIQLKNTGDANLMITQITVAGTGFSDSGVGTMPLSLVAGATTSFNVKFAPTTPASGTGTLTVTSNSPDSPATIPLTGTGTTASLTLSLSATSLNFGSVNTGSSTTKSFSITNTGNGDVAISSIAASGTGFSISSGGTAVTLTPTQSVTVVVQFAPGTAGNLTGAVTITSNAAGSPATVTLDGTGVTATAHSAALSWVASSSTVVGYNVYRSTTSGSYGAPLNGSLVSGVSFTDTAVVAGTTYFYVTTAVDGGGNESVFSNEVQAAIP